MIQFKVNGVDRSFDGDPDMPLLWYLRDGFGLTGTKFGCGIALCGACTVHQEWRGDWILRYRDARHGRHGNHDDRRPGPKWPASGAKSMDAGQRARNAAIASPDKSCRPWLS